MCLALPIVLCVYFLKFFLAYLLLQDTLISDHGNSVSVGESSGSGDLCKSSTSGSLNSNNQNGSNSDISCHDDEDMIDDDADMIDDDGDEDADYDFDYNDDDIYEDDYSSMQDQLDNVDLPPGVEASLPWLKDISSCECKQAVAFSRTESSSKAKVDETEDIVLQKFRQFKQFDTVDSFPDHHYDKEETKDAQVINIGKLFLCNRLHLPTCIFKF